MRQVLGGFSITLFDLLFTGFAIPIDVVKRVVPQLVAKGRVTRASLNVQVSMGGGGNPGGANRSCNVLGSSLRLVWVL